MAACNTDTSVTHGSILSHPFEATESGHVCKVDNLPAFLARYNLRKSSLGVWMPNWFCFLVPYSFRARFEMSSAPRAARTSAMCSWGCVATWYTIIISSTSTFKPGGLLLAPTPMPSQAMKWIGAPGFLGTTWLDIQAFSEVFSRWPAWFHIKRDADPKLLLTSLRNIAPQIPSEIPAKNLLRTLYILRSTLSKKPVTLPRNALLQSRHFGVHPTSMYLCIAGPSSAPYTAHPGVAGLAHKRPSMTLKVYRRNPRGFFKHVSSSSGMPLFKLIVCYPRSCSSCLPLPLPLQDSPSFGWAVWGGCGVWMSATFKHRTDQADSHCPSKPSRISSPSRACCSPSLASKNGHQLAPSFVTWPLVTWAATLKQQTQRYLVL